MDQVATHLRLLSAAVARTTGPVVELGCGWYSTPLLHELCRAAGRPLKTLDNQPYWLPPFEKFRGPGHSVERVGWWGDCYEALKVGGRIGLCFADHGQPIEREYAARALRDVVDVWVFHDTEEGHAYGYDRILPTFKYQFTDKSQKAWTTVASNVTDVTAWGLVELDPHEPEQGVT